MATATIHAVFCVRQATGTDIGVIQALAGLAAELRLDELGGIGALEDAVKAVPGVVEAMDSAQAAPDNLYITTATGGGLDNRIWPLDAETVDMQAGQSNALGIAVPVSFSQNVSLWDRDSFLDDDDLLGSITILGSDQGAGLLSKLAKSDVESSYYYVTYEVN